MPSSTHHKIYNKIAQGKAFKFNIEFGTFLSLKTVLK